MLRIWGRTNSVNVQKVMWAVDEVGQPYERIDAGGSFGKLDTDAYAALNPNRLVPVLEDGATVVWESNAIVRYLAARYAADTLWAEDPIQRSQADRWMDWQLATLQPVLGIIFWGLIRTLPEKRDMAAIEGAAQRIQDIWQVLERHLADRPFVAGDSLSMGDIPAGCAYWRYRNLDVAKPELPHIDRWFARLEERPGYRAHVMLPVT